MLFDCPLPPPPMNKPLVLIPFSYSSRESVFILVYLFDPGVTQSNWMPNTELTLLRQIKLKRNQLQIINCTESRRSIPLASQASSCLHKGISSGVNPPEPGQVSTLLFLQWVEPTGTLLIRLKPDRNPKSSLRGNLASGLPFQPKTLCKVDCHYGKKKKFLTKITLKLHVLVIQLHLLDLVLFPSLQPPSPGSSEVLPEAISQYSFQCSLYIEGAMGLLLGCCQQTLRQGIK